MTNRLEKIIKSYKILSHTPSIISAAILNNGKLIETIWSQRNVENKKYIKILTNHVLNSNFKVIYETTGIDVTNELLSSTSPSEKFRAVIRRLENKDDKKQFLEIWDRGKLLRCVDLNSLDIHGDVYTDIDFGSFEWASDETKIIYIAEKNNHQISYLNTRKFTEKNSENNKRGQYTYLENWGELLSDRKESVVVEYNLEKDTVQILEGIPENVCPGQVIWSPENNYIVGVAYKTKDRKLGLAHSSNRPNTLFYLDFNKNYQEVSIGNNCVKCPRFTPDGRYVIWLQRSLNGPHLSTMALARAEVPLNISTPEIIIDIVDTSIEIGNGKIFYGIYNTLFPKRCWTNNGRLIFSSLQINVEKVYIADVERKLINEFSYTKDNCTVLDVYDDIVLVARKFALSPDKLVACKLNEHDKEDVNDWIEITSIQAKEKVEKFTCFEMLLEHKSNENVTKFSATYLGPTEGKQHELPFILCPHGGPHSAYVNKFSLPDFLLLVLGYAIIFINFRGSLGIGKKSIDFLLGNIGKSDVADCILTLQSALEIYPWLDPKRVFLLGNSYGGFLTAHLCGLYQSLFKAAVIRNPVIDIATMSTSTDMPDWCYVEIGDEFQFKNTSDEKILLKMRNVSPIINAHKVKTPTLIQIGTKDLRVPSAQGKEYYHILKSNNCITQLEVYDDNHLLHDLKIELDKLISTILWFDKHCCKN